MGRRVRDHRRMFLVPSPRPRWAAGFLGLLVVLLIASALPTVAAPTARGPGPRSPSGLHGERGVDRAGALRSASGSLAQGTGPSNPRAPSPLGAPTGYWFNLTNLSNGPSAREMPMIAYDAADGYVLLFGGGDFHGGTSSSETWTFSGGVWTQQSPSTSPPARMGGVMTYDAADGYVLMFGGYDPGGGGFYGDTWTYSAGTWTQLSLSTHPAARWGMGMAYDSADGYVVLFGGEAGFGSYQSDTWTFSSGSWTQLSPTTHPGTRGDVNLGYDAHDREVVLYCGEAGGPSINETWNYSNGNWTNLTGSLSFQPPAQTNVAIAYDPDYSGMVFLDPAIAGANPTYLFSNNAWSHLTSSTWPASVTRERSTYDAADGLLLEFGGEADRSPSPVWNYTWSLAPHPLTHLALSPTAVDTGSPLRVTASVIPAISGAAFSYAGLPPGCASANVSTFTCRPTQVGTYAVNATITAPGGASVTTANVSLQVFAAPVVGGLTASPSPVTQGRPLNLSTHGASGTGPLAFAYAGTPSGCPSVNQSWLACSPAAGGAYNVTVTVTDPRRGSASTWVTFDVNARVALATFSVSPGPDVDVNSTVTLTAVPSGGSGPLTFAFYGLPPGCASVDRPTLTCAPTAAGLYTVHLHANDSQGSSANVTVQLAVAPDPVVGPVVITPRAIDLGSTLTLSANVTGGTQPISVSWSGLPTGCASGGSLGFQCVPKATGTFHATVTVTDAAGMSTNASADFTVNPLPRIVGVTYPTAGWDVGRSFAITVEATGGTGLLTYAFQTSGSTHACTPAASNATVCTSSQTGAVSFRVTVADGLGLGVSVTGAVAIHDLPSIAAFSSTPAETGVGGTVNFSFTASGGTGSLGTHLGGFSGDCVLLAPPGYACVANAAGTFNVTLTVTDAAGAEANASTLVVVSPASSPAPANSGVPLTTLDLGLILVAAIAVGVVVWFVVRGRIRPPAPPSAEPPPPPNDEPPP